MCRCDSLRHGKDTQGQSESRVWIHVTRAPAPRERRLREAHGRVSRERATAGLWPVTMRSLGSLGKGDSPASAVTALQSVTLHSAQCQHAVVSTQRHQPPACSGPHCPRTGPAALESQSVRATQSPTWSSCCAVKSDTPREGEEERQE